MGAPLNEDQFGRPHTSYNRTSAQQQAHARVMAQDGGHLWRPGGLGTLKRIRLDGSELASTVGQKHGRN